jgi:hypothetical protein
LKLAFEAITHEILVEENVMRKLSAAAVAMVLAIALYFTLFWGFEALRMLTSPTYGLEEVWRSQFIFAIGHYLSLSPLGLIKLAAFFATLKLAVAAICAVYIIDRFRTLVSGKADSGILEAGLLLIVVISNLSVGPAVWSKNAELVREYALQLLLAGVAAGLCVLERTYQSPSPKAAAKVADRALYAAPRGATWFSPWR